MEIEGYGDSGEIVTLQLDDNSFDKDTTYEGMMKMIREIRRCFKIFNGSKTPHERLERLGVFVHQFKNMKISSMPHLSNHLNLQVVLKVLSNEYFNLFSNEKDDFEKFLPLLRTIFLCSLNQPFDVCYGFTTTLIFTLHNLISECDNFSSNLLIDESLAGDDAQEKDEVYSSLLFPIVNELEKFTLIESGTNFRRPEDISVSHVFNHRNPHVFLSGMIYYLIKDHIHFSSSSIVTGRNNNQLMKELLSESEDTISVLFDTFHVALQKTKKENWREFCVVGDLITLTLSHMFKAASSDVFEIHLLKPELINYFLNHIRRASTKKKDDEEQEGEEEEEEEEEEKIFEPLYFLFRLYCFENILLVMFHTIKLIPDLYLQFEQVEGYKDLEKLFSDELFRVLQEINNTENNNNNEEEEKENAELKTLIEQKTLSIMGTFVCFVLDLGKKLQTLEVYSGHNFHPSMRMTQIRHNKKVFAIALRIFDSWSERLKSIYHENKIITLKDQENIEELLKIPNYFCHFEFLNQIAHILANFPREYFESFHSMKPFGILAKHFCFVPSNMQDLVLNILDHYIIFYDQHYRSQKNPHLFQNRIQASYIDIRKLKIMMFQFVEVVKKKKTENEYYMLSVNKMINHLTLLLKQESSESFKELLRVSGYNDLIYDALSVHKDKITLHSLLDCLYYYLLNCRKNMVSYLSTPQKGKTLKVICDVMFRIPELIDPTLRVLKLITLQDTTQQFSALSEMIRVLSSRNASLDLQNATLSTLYEIFQHYRKNRIIISKNFRENLGFECLLEVLRQTGVRRRILLRIRQHQKVQRRRKKKLRKLRKLKKLKKGETEDSKKPPTLESIFSKLEKEEEEELSSSSSSSSSEEEEDEGEIEEEEEKKKRKKKKKKNRNEDFILDQVLFEVVQRVIWNLTILLKISRQNQEYFQYELNGFQSLLLPIHRLEVIRSPILSQGIKMTMNLFQLTFLNLDLYNPSSSNKKNNKDEKERKRRRRRRRRRKKKNKRVEKYFDNSFLENEGEEDNQLEDFYYYYHEEANDSGVFQSYDSVIFEIQEVYGSKGCKMIHHPEVISQVIIPLLGGENLFCINNQLLSLLFSMLDYLTRVNVYNRARLCDSRTTISLLTHFRPILKNEHHFQHRYSIKLFLVLARYSTFVEDLVSFFSLFKKEQQEEIAEFLKQEEKEKEEDKKKKNTKEESKEERKEKKERQTKIKEIKQLLLPSSSINFPEDLIDCAVELATYKNTDYFANNSLLFPPHEEAGMVQDPSQRIVLPKLSYQSWLSEGKGYTWVFWFNLIDIEPNARISFVRLTDSKKKLCVNYGVNETRQLFVELFHEKDRKEEVFLKTMFRQDKWYHVSISHRMDLSSKNTHLIHTFVLFVDGEFYEKQEISIQLEDNKVFTFFKSMLRMIEFTLEQIVLGEKSYVFPKPPKNTSPSPKSSIKRTKSSSSVSSSRTATTSYTSSSRRSTISSTSSTASSSIRKKKRRSRRRRKRRMRIRPRLDSQKFDDVMKEFEREVMTSYEIGNMFMFNTDQVEEKDCFMMYHLGPNYSNDFEEPKLSRYFSYQHISKSSIQRYGPESMMIMKLNENLRHLGEKLLMVYSARNNNLCSRIQLNKSSNSVLETYSPTSPVSSASPPSPIMKMKKKTSTSHITKTSSRSYSITMNNFQQRRRRMRRGGGVRLSGKKSFVEEEEEEEGEERNSSLEDLVKHQQSLDITDKKNTINTSSNIRKKKIKNKKKKKKKKKKGDSLDPSSMGGKLEISVSQTEFTSIPCELIGGVLHTSRFTLKSNLNSIGGIDQILALFGIIGKPKNSYRIKLLHMICELLKHDALNTYEMDSIFGYHLVSYLVRQVDLPVDLRLFDTVLCFCGIKDRKILDDYVMTNHNAVGHILLDYHIWENGSVEIQKMIYKTLTYLVTQHPNSGYHLEFLRHQKIVERIIHILLEMDKEGMAYIHQSVIDEMYHCISAVLSSPLTLDDFKQLYYHFVASRPDENLLFYNNELCYARDKTIEMIFRKMDEEFVTPEKLEEFHKVFSIETIICQLDHQCSIIRSFLLDILRVYLVRVPKLGDQFSSSANQFYEKVVRQLRKHKIERPEIISLFHLLLGVTDILKRDEFTEFFPKKNKKKRRRRGRRRKNKKNKKKKAGMGRLFTGAFSRDYDDPSLLLVKTQHMIPLDTEGGEKEEEEEEVDNDDNIDDDEDDEVEDFSESGVDEVEIVVDISTEEFLPVIMNLIPCLATEPLKCQTIQILYNLFTKCDVRMKRVFVKWEVEKYLRRYLDQDCLKNNSQLLSQILNFFIELFLFKMTDVSKRGIMTIESVLQSLSTIKGYDNESSEHYFFQSVQRKLISKLLVHFRNQVFFENMDDKLCHLFSRFCTVGVDIIKLFELTVSLPVHPMFITSSSEDETEDTSTEEAEEDEEMLAGFTTMQSLDWYEKKNSGKRNSVFARPIEDLSVTSFWIVDTMCLVLEKIFQNRRRVNSNKSKVEVVLMRALKAMIIVLINSQHFNDQICSLLYLVYGCCENSESIPDQHPQNQPESDFSDKTIVIDFLKEKKYACILVYRVSQILKMPLDIPEGRIRYTLLEKVRSIISSQKKTYLNSLIHNSESVKNLVRLVMKWEREEAKERTKELNSIRDHHQKMSRLEIEMDESIKEKIRRYESDLSKTKEMYLAKYKLQREKIAFDEELCHVKWKEILKRFFNNRRNILSGGKTGISTRYLGINFGDDDMNLIDTPEKKVRGTSSMGLISSGSTNEYVKKEQEFYEGQSRNWKLDLCCSENRVRTRIYQAIPTEYEFLKTRRRRRRQRVMDRRQRRGRREKIVKKFGSHVGSGAARSNIDVLKGEAEEEVKVEGGLSEEEEKEGGKVGDEVKGGIFDDDDIHTIKDNEDLFERLEQQEKKMLEIEKKRQDQEEQQNDEEEEDEGEEDETDPKRSPLPFFEDDDDDLEDDDEEDDHPPLVLFPGEKEIIYRVCKRVTPYNRFNGTLYLYTRQFYFHGRACPPNDDGFFEKPSGKEKWSTYRYEEVEEVHKRRFILENNGLEIFFMSGRSYFFAFRTHKDRELMYKHLHDRGRCPNLKKYNIKNLQKKWKNREISNFEYLIHLNTLSGRSFNDLIQYPVFPHVISDYTSPSLDLEDPNSFRNLSKPMGALSEERLERARTKYEMLKQTYREGSFVDQKPFFWGTHYSTPLGTVLFYLIRLEPFTKCFYEMNDHKLDPPERTFFSMRRAWENSSGKGNVKTSDVRELIPEFYFLPEMFQNRNRLRWKGFQNEKFSGKYVDNVELPPWSNGNPVVFVRKHREALESEYVSTYLSNWIDLIFGTFQRGEGAVDHANLYPAFCYDPKGGEEGDGGGNLFDDSEGGNRIEQEAIKKMIMNYGQVPRQIFVKKHPGRNPKIQNPYVITQESVVYLNTYDVKKSNEVIGDISLYDDMLVAVGMNKILLPKYKKTLEVRLSTTELSDVRKSEMRILHYTGQWNKCMKITSWNTGRMTDMIFQSTKLDEYTCGKFSSDGSTLVIGSSHCVVHVFELSEQRILRRSISLPGHTRPVTDVYVSKLFNLIISGSEDGSMILYDLHKFYFIRCIWVNSPVSLICMNSQSGDIACVTTSADNYDTIWLFTVNGDLIRTRSLRNLKHSQHNINNNWKVTALKFSHFKIGVEKNMLYIGYSSGFVDIVDAFSLKKITRLHPSKETAVPITNITLNEEQTCLGICDENGTAITLKVDIKKLIK